MGWVAQQSEEQQQQQQQHGQLSSAASVGQEQHAGVSFWQQQEQEHLMQLGSLGGIPSIAEGQQLQLALQHQQLLRRHSEDSKDEAGGKYAADQAVAPRSMSWSTARPPATAAFRQWKANGHGDRATDTSAYVQPQQLTAGATAAATGAGAAAAAGSGGLDSVFALHLGAFRFKGSGEYEMVQLLHGALAGRVFPAEPPRGKGERLGGAAGGAVRDLPAVHLRLPAALVAGRHTVVRAQGDDGKKGRSAAGD
jgi:hypothetical protein